MKIGGCVRADAAGERRVSLARPHGVDEPGLKLLARSALASRPHLDPFRLTLAIALPHDVDDVIQPVVRGDSVAGDQIGIGDAEALGLEIGQGVHRLAGDDPVLDGVARGSQTDDRLSPRHPHIGRDVVATDQIDFP